MQPANIFEQVVRIVAAQKVPERNQSIDIPGTNIAMSRRSDDAIIVRIGPFASKALAERHLEYKSATSNNGTGVWAMAGALEGNPDMARCRFDEWWQKVGGNDEA